MGAAGEPDSLKFAAGLRSILVRTAFPSAVRIVWLPSGATRATEDPVLPAPDFGVPPAEAGADPRDAAEVDAFGPRPPPGLLALGTLPVGLLAVGSLLLELPVFGPAGWLELGPAEPPAFAWALPDAAPLLAGLSDVADFAGVGVDCCWKALDVAQAT